MNLLETARFAVKSLLGQLVFIVLLIVSVDKLPILLGQYMQKLQWLPHSLLLVAAVMSVQFGYSRLFIASLLLLASLYLPAIPAGFIDPLQVQHFLPIVLVTSMTTLMWDKERGFSPVALLSALVLLVCANAAVIIASMSLHMTSAEWLNQLLQPPSIAKMKFSGAELLLLVMIQIIGIIRFILAPTNRHAALMLATLSVSGMMLYFGMILPQLMLSMLAAAFCVLILHDSYNMAFKDELTGIKGRRALMQYAATLGKKYVVVMADVDKFKSFNDKYGHDVGDQVLKMVASCVDKVGGGGRAFRYGGEEFTIVFANKSAQQAKVFVEAVRETIGARPFLLRDQDRPKSNSKQRKNPPKKSQQVFVTASFGVAECGQQLTEFDDVMKAADGALYKAKAAGRNCVKLAP
ncbi:GGDEF domain-containing protein [Neptunicella marina]|uniref:diguanylate cyclase n=1 Tax=Neptunicella marina TaxID=2125989 RepID=A0A8J6LV43_9ALTE|nr:GGDEF domain-containing protein [Neptunicella marina]MBC3764319.1 GGDEF domain-containing protein [Neptunicella marina]